MGEEHFLIIYRLQKRNIISLILSLSLFPIYVHELYLCRYAESCLEEMAGRRSERESAVKSIKRQWDFRKFLNDDQAHYNTGRISDKHTQANTHLLKIRTEAVKPKLQRTRKKKAEKKKIVFMKLLF